MAYTDYVRTTPDPTTQTPGQAFTSDRNNQLALRDALIGGAGYMPVMPRTPTAAGPPAPRTSRPNCYSAKAPSA